MESGLTMYEVANREQIDAIKTAGIAQGSPGRNARIRVVASDVLVIATFIPAAVQRTASCIGTVSGKTKYSNRPKAAPEHIKGKMYPRLDLMVGKARASKGMGCSVTSSKHNVPPLSPPATVKDIAINLHTPTMNAVKGLSISNPSNPVVGQILGRSLAGPILATIWISSSPQKAVSHGIETREALLRHCNSKGL
jgi:hypothetical protein